MTCTTESTVELFPLAITRTHFKFQVVGLGSTRCVFLTADETVALKFLEKDKVVAKAAARLARYNARTDIRYPDLVERLAAARLVHRIDGHVIEPPYAGWRRVLIDAVAHRLAALPAAAGRAWQAIGSRMLPIDWMIALNRAAIALSIRKARRERIVNRVSGNVTRLIGDVPIERARACARRALSDLIRMMAELALLQEADDDRVCRWVRQSMTRYDVEPLRNALAKGKGGIVFHFHMGPIQYVPLLLSALGFKVTLLGMSIARPKRTRMYFSVVDDLRPGGVVKLVRALERGEVVIISPDVDIHALDAGGPARTERDSVFAGAWQKGSIVPLTFLGHRIETYTGLVWLQEQSGAPLIFASVERDAHGEVSLTCAPFALPTRGPLSRREWTERAMTRIYHHYERQLLARPEQWMHWMTFFPRQASHASR